MNKTCTTEIESLVSKALEGIKRNLTDHVFWEIQRNTDLFREYVVLLAGKDCEIKPATYRTVHSKVARTVQKVVGAKSLKAGKAENPALNKTFTRFSPDTVKL